MKHIKNMVPSAHYLAAKGKRMAPITTPPENPRTPDHNGMDPSIPVSLSDLDENHHPLIKAVIAALRKWGEQYKRGVKNSFVIVGPNGVGKTHMTIALLWAIRLKADGAADQPLPRFHRASKISAELDKAHPSLFVTVDRAQPYRNTPYIIIDDIGMEYQPTDPDWKKNKARAAWSKLFDYCYTNDIPMILSGSNNAGTIERLQNHLGPRAWDRLLEMAPAGNMFPLTGVPSYREKKGGRS